MDENEPLTPDEPAAAPAPEERVFIADKYGRKFSVPASQQMKAIEQGFVPESTADKDERELQAQYGDTAGQAKAFSAAAARGASFGLSDLALTKTGLVNPETLEKLKEANPGANIAGEVTGTAASLLVGPGGALAKGVGLVGEGVGGVAGRVVAGALEGSAYGIGNTISEASLGDTELNAQKLAGGAGVGALLGGGLAFGGVLAEHLAAKGAGKAAEALEDLPGQLKDYAEERAAKATGGTKAAFRGMDKEEIRQHGRNLLDLGLINPGDKATDIATAIPAAKERVGAQIGDILEKVDALNPRRADLPEKLFTESERLERRSMGLSAPTLSDVSESAGGFDMGSFVKRAREDVLAPLEGDPALESQYRKAKRLLDGYSKMGDITTVRANELKSNLQKTINFNSTKIEQDVANKIQGIFLDEVDSTVGRVGGDELKAELKQVKSQYGTLKWAEKVAGQQSVPASVGNRNPFSQTDYFGAMIGAHVGGPVGAVVGATANKTLREYAPAAVASTLDKLAQHPAFETMAEAFSKFASKHLEMAPEVLGEYGPTLAHAVASGPVDALLTHGILSEHPAYRQRMTEAGLDYTEDGSQVHQQALHLAALKLELQKHDSNADESIRGALSGAKPKSGGSGGLFRSELLGDSKTGPLKPWDERLKSLQRLAENTDELTGRIAATLGPMQAMAPELATAMATTLTRGVQFLAEKSPKPSGDPITDNIPALRRQYEPSDAQKRQFERYAAAVNDPNSVFDGLRHGTVTREAVEALQAVYPDLLNDVRQRTVSALGTRKDPLPFSQQVALSRLLGTPLAPSMRPDRLLELQAAHATAGTQQQPPPGGGPGGPKGRALKSSDFSAEQTSSQRSEGRAAKS